MLTYSFENIASESMYEHLYRCIKQDILQKKLRAGEKLPSKRSFAKNLGVSTITVESAYAQLVAELVLSIASVIMLARIFRRMQREDGALGEGAEGGSAFRV